MPKYNTTDSDFIEEVETYEDEPKIQYIEPDQTKIEEIDSNNIDEDRPYSDSDAYSDSESYDSDSDSDAESNPDTDVNADSNTDKSYQKEIEEIDSNNIFYNNLFCNDICDEPYSDSDSLTNTLDRIQIEEIDSNDILYDDISYPDSDSSLSDSPDPSNQIEETDSNDILIDEAYESDSETMVNTKNIKNTNRSSTNIDIDGSFVSFSKTQKYLI
jgi:hypothetical protein